MPTYDVTSRKTGPIVVEQITADHKEDAIAQVVATAEEGGSVEVLQVVQTDTETGASPKK